MFFDGWHGIILVFTMATLGYLALLVMLRLSRKRSLAKMNVFDFVYVVVVGELLAITIMDERIPLVNGLAAVAALILLQVLVSWLTTRSNRVERVINGEPSLELRSGRFLHDAMQAQRITERRILAAVRADGLSDLEPVEAVAPSRATRVRPMLQTARTVLATRWIP